MEAIREPESKASDSRWNPWKNPEVWSDLDDVVEWDKARGPGEVLRDQGLGTTTSVLKLMLMGRLP